MILALVAACGPGAGAGDTGTTAEPGTTAAPTSGPAPTSTGDGTSTGSTGTTGSGGPGTGTSADAETTTTGEPTTGPDATDAGSETGETACAMPDAEAVAASWEVTMDGMPPPLDGFAWPCLVVMSDAFESMWEIDLECQTFDGPVDVHFSIERAPGGGSNPVWVDDMVLLDYRAQQIFWTNQWFTLRLAAAPIQVLVAGISADSPVPPDTTALDYYELELAVQDGLCDPVDDGGACPPTVRLALDMAWSAAKRRLFDGQRGALVDLAGDIEVWVERATRPDDESGCDDVPPAWFEVVMTGNFGP